MPDGAGVAKKRKGDKVDRCPRCKKDKLRKPKAHNALSRRDNKTYICSDCGVSEAMFDFTVHSSLQTERAWLKEVKDGPTNNR